MTKEEFWKKWGLVGCCEYKQDWCENKQDWCEYPPCKSGDDKQEMFSDLDKLFKSDGDIIEDITGCWHKRWERDNL